MPQGAVLPATSWPGRTACSTPPRCCVPCARGCAPWPRPLRCPSHGREAHGVAGVPAAAWHHAPFAFTRCWAPLAVQHRPWLHTSAPAEGDPSFEGYKKPKLGSKMMKLRSMVTTLRKAASSERERAGGCACSLLRGKAYATAADLCVAGGCHTRHLPLGRLLCCTTATACPNCPPRPPARPCRRAEAGHWCGELRCS